MSSMKDVRIAVISLGDVGLPLARLFSTKFQAIGHDMNQTCVDGLMSDRDATMEVCDNLLQETFLNRETGIPQPPSVT